MQKFNAETLRQIPIVEVLRLLGETPTRKSGKVVLFKGTHGLRAYPDTNTYHCFAGKRGSGDVISLVKNYLNTDFLGACSWLADNFNLREYKSERLHNPAKNPQKMQAVESDKCYYPNEILQSTLKAYASNSFILACKNVISDVKTDDLERLISLYKIGTVQSEKSVFWNGACTFPAIDACGNVHTIQVKLFKPDLHTDKWTKNGETGQKVTFIHSIIQKYCERAKKPVPTWLREYQRNGARLSRCLFGEHLLSQFPNNIVGVVEAPKTALIGTLYEGFPDDDKDNILWVAVWAKGYLKNLLPNLRGRKVILFPDASPNDETYREWKAISANFKNVTVSDVLCGISSNEDAADYWLKTSISAYRYGVAEHVPASEEQSEHVSETKSATNCETATNCEATIPREFVLLFKSIFPSYDKTQTEKEFAVRLYREGFIGNVSDSAKVTSLIKEAIVRGYITETLWQYRIRNPAR